VGSGGCGDLYIKPVALLGDQEDAVWGAALCALYVAGGGVCVGWWGRVLLKILQHLLHSVVVAFGDCKL